MDKDRVIFACFTYSGPILRDKLSSVALTNKSTEELAAFLLVRSVVHHIDSIIPENTFRIGL